MYANYVLLKIISHRWLENAQREIQVTLRQFSEKVDMVPIVTVVEAPYWRDLGVHGLSIVYSDSQLTRAEVEKLEQDSLKIFTAQWKKSKRDDHGRPDRLIMCETNESMLVC